MRVVAGRARGRRLAEVPDGTRPTSDRAREAVFNSLVSLGAVDGATVVDLYAGTGALGIEAWSRGAATVTFVDSSAAAVATIGENLATVGCTDATVVRSPVERFVADAGAGAFDLALVDAPYGTCPWPTLLASGVAPLVVAEDGAPVEAPPGWTVRRSRRYGRSWMTILERPAAGSVP